MAKPTNKKKAFFDKYYKTVSDSLEGTGLFPEMVINQMGIESDWGTSGLTTKHNNFFGIKKGKSDSSSVNMASDEERDGKKVSEKSDFRTYDSVEDSIKDYVNVLKTQGKGKTYAKVFEAKTPMEQAKAIGDSPYATGSNYGKTIQNTMKASERQKLTTGYTGKKNKKTMNQRIKDKFIGDYESKKEEIEYLKKKHGENSKEYKDAKKDLDRKVVYLVRLEQNTKEKSLQDSIDKAEKDGDWGLASKLMDEQESFEKNKIDFSKTKPSKKMVSNESTDEEGKIHGFGSRVVIDGKEVDLDLDKIYEQYEASSAVEEEESTVQDEIDIPDDDDDYEVEDPAAEKEEEIYETRDDAKTEEDLGTDATEGEGTDYDAVAKERQKEIDALDEIEAEEFNFEEANPNESNLLENLGDTARGVVGMIGATEEVPEYERGSMWNTAMGEAEKRREEGLTPDELNYRNQQAEQAYAYGIKNIEKGAGGNAGAYLGNIGAEQQRLMGEYGKNAAIDEELRRDNRSNFQSMAGKDEVINRQIFKDDLDQVLKNKQQGAALVGDAINDIKERAQYKKKYGKDSAAFKYKESLREDRESNVFHRDKAAKTKAAEARAKLVYERDKALEKSGDSGEIGNEENDALVDKKQDEANANQESEIPTSGSGDNLVNGTINEKGDYVKTTGGTFKSIPQDEEEASAETNEQRWAREQAEREAEFADEEVTDEEVTDEEKEAELLKGLSKALDEDN